MRTSIPTHCRCLPGLLACFALAAAMTGSAHAVEPGSAAPAFALGQARLADHTGKVVYLDFWASWCGPCRKSFPWMTQMQAKYGKQGLQVVGVNLDAKAADAQIFLAAMPAGFIVGFDPAGATARAYGVKGMPTSVLIGVDGKVLLQHAGFNDDDRQMLESRIKQALEAIK